MGEMVMLDGGILGLLGSLLGKSFNFVDKWQESKLLEKKMQHELLLLQMQQESKTRELESEEYIAESKSFSEIRKESYKHDYKAGKATQWVIDFLRLVRPILTITLVVLITLLWFNIEEENSDLRTQMVDSILFCFTAALTWWFGDRYPKKK